MIIFLHFSLGSNLSSLFKTHCIYWQTTHTIDVQSSAAKETERGRKSKGGYIDEARGLLFSLLISLNLLIPILKPATLQCWCLLCVAPSQIKLLYSCAFQTQWHSPEEFELCFPSLRYRRPYLFPDALCKLGHL